MLPIIPPGIPPGMPRKGKEAAKGFMRAAMGFVNIDALFMPPLTPIPVINTCFI
jgi:hypothetical protein